MKMSRCVGMVDEADSKSVASDGVWVRVPPPAPKNDRAVVFLIICVLLSVIRKRHKWTAQPQKQGIRS